MKILFDHGTPRPLRRSLYEHSVDTAADKGWDRLINGELIDRAEQEGYEAIITTDQSMRYQQNLVGRRLIIVVLMKTMWPLEIPQIEEIRAAVSDAQPGELREVYIPPS